MQKEHEYHTGEIIGLTSLKLSSVQRYIKTFNPFFSELAKLSDRRRRLTPSDVKKLLLIKYLYSIRYDQAGIESVLLGEKDAPNVAWLEITNALEIAKTAHEAQKKAEAAQKNVEKQFKDNMMVFNSAFSQIRSIARTMESDIKHCRSEVDRCSAMQNADARMTLDVLRTLENKRDLDKNLRRKLHHAVMILEQERREKILSDRQRLIADKIVSDREQNAESESIKKETFGQRFENFMHRISHTSYELEQEEEAKRQEEQRWEEGGMGEEE